MSILIIGEKPNVGKAISTVVVADKSGKDISRGTAILYRGVSVIWWA